MVCICHSLAACQRHTPSSLAAVIGLSNNGVISLRSLRCVRCVGWKHRLSHRRTSALTFDLLLGELATILHWIAVVRRHFSVDQ